MAKQIRTYDDMNGFYADQKAYPTLAGLDRYRRDPDPTASSLPFVPFAKSVVPLPKNSPHNSFLLSLFDYYGKLTT
jgi:hypothetical protein